MLTNLDDQYLSIKLISHRLFGATVKLLACDLVQMDFTHGSPSANEGAWMCTFEYLILATPTIVG